MHSRQAPAAACTASSKAHDLLTFALLSHADSMEVLASASLACERPILHPFGSQAAARDELQRPLALRPGLATGLPLSRMQRRQAFASRRPLPTGFTRCVV